MAARYQLSPQTTRAVFVSDEVVQGKFVSPGPARDRTQLREQCRCQPCVWIALRASEDRREVAVARAREQDSGGVGRPILVWREDWRESDGISTSVDLLEVGELTYTIGLCGRWL